MRVIAVASQKGGSGKTTLSGHLAVQAELAGDGPVALIDVDPQGSLSAWWNERKAEAPLFAQTTLTDLRDDLVRLEEAGIRLVIVDTPPAITTAIHEVISVADFVIIPARPSPHDLRSVGATVSLVQRCKKPLCFVVNDATPRARITAEAAISLSQYGTVAPVTIHHRTDFASAMIDGRTVMELSDSGKSSQEISGLWSYLHARLENEISPAVFHIHGEQPFEGVTVGVTAAAKTPLLKPQLRTVEAEPVEMAPVAAPVVQAPAVQIPAPVVAAAVEIAPVPAPAPVRVEETTPMRKPLRYASDEVNEEFSTFRLLPTGGAVPLDAQAAVDTMVLPEAAAAPTPSVPPEVVASQATGFGATVSRLFGRRL